MYNYQDAMIRDIKEYIREGIKYGNYGIDLKTVDHDELYRTFNRDMSVADEVTGALSSMYSFLHEETGYGSMRPILAREAVINNMFLLAEAAEVFHIDNELLGQYFIAEEWLYFDSIIRRFVYENLVHRAIDELIEEEQK